MTKFTRVSLTVGVMVSLFNHAARPASSSQLSNAPVKDSVIAIGVFLHVRGSLYAQKNGNAFVIYVGEEVQLDVTVVNGTDAAIQLGNEAQTWVDDLRVTIERQPEPHAGGGPVRISARPRAAPRGPVTLLPDRSTNTQVMLTTDANQPLRPGTYTIAVELPTISTLGTGHNISRRMVSFEIREPLRREDTLDYYLHQAYRARVENRPKDQRIWLDRVFAMHPGSLAAWLDLADATFRQGDCKGAVRALTRALTLLSSNADPELRARPPAEHEVFLRQRLEKCEATAR